MSALAPSRRALRGPAWIREPALVVPALVAVIAAGLAGISHSHHLGGLPGLIRGSAASLILFLVCGEALGRWLTPAPWRRLCWFFALPLGAVASGLVLMAFGVAHVPLRVSLWVTLALGLAASWWVRRHPQAHDSAPAQPAASGSAPGALLTDRRSLLAWAVVLAIVFCVALIPAGRTNGDTIYGQNPDASQVVGIAVLFQHVPPTATDDALPLDVVPQEWRFRYPIFYPLAAASSLSHFDPIRVFPAMVALLAVIAVLGFALLAVAFLGAPKAAGPAVAAVLGFSWVVQYLAWHPYWNQMWGLALMPYTLLFGWKAARDWDGRSVLLCVLFLLALWFAYPLALPYPVVILVALVIAYWRKPTMPRVAGPRAWLAVVVGLCLLLPAVVGSILKLKEAISQLLTPGSDLWGGDITHFISFGHFVGTGGDIVAALAVAAVAAFGLPGLERRAALALGLVLSALCLLDLRFRLVSSGPYMDFKHLSFVGTLVLTLAASAVLRLIWSRSRLTLLGAALAIAWTVPALRLDRANAIAQQQQVTAAMFQIRDWAAKLPAGASVSVDVPASDGGAQLWAVYMLGDHPVNSPTPVIGTTYAYAPKGGRADYSLDLRYYPNVDPAVKRPFPPGFATVEPPVFVNGQFVLRRILWPKQLDWYPQTASTKLTEVG